jgi:serine/threonine protein kinase
VSLAIRPGDDFAGYRIEQLIGRGGMGVVYRATDLSLERQVRRAGVVLGGDPFNAPTRS